MQRQPWGIPAFTNGNPSMQQQPCEEPVFSKQDFDMPQPQQQQPNWARARAKQPAGQAIRQQAGSFRAPRPSRGHASNSLPPPPQQVSFDILHSQTGACLPEAAFSLYRPVGLEPGDWLIGMLGQLVENNIQQLPDLVTSSFESSQCSADADM